MVSNNKFRLILLDRDGVINQERPGYVKSVDELVIIPGSIQAIKKFSDAGIKLAVITNQGCIGRGIISHEQLQEIHDHLLGIFKKNQIKLDKIYVCPDHPDQPSFRRKPNPGMLLEAMIEMGETAENTLMIGDDIRDLQAATAAKCHRHLVLTGHGEKTRIHENFKNITPIVVHKDLKAAGDYIIKEYINGI